MTALAIIAWLLATVPTAIVIGKAIRRGMGQRRHRDGASGAEIPFYHDREVA